jgi:hypothetical protein
MVERTGFSGRQMAGARAPKTARYTPDMRTRETQASSPKSRIQYRSGPK